MSTLTIPNTFVDGATIEAAEHNANFTAVKNFVESTTAGTNIDAGAIQTAAIANSAITSAKIATGAVTGTKLEDSIALTGTTSASTITVTANIVYHITTNAQTVSYTLVLADDGKIIECSSSSALTLTVPANNDVAFPIGTQIMLIQTGSGQLTVAGAGGVTVNATPGLKLRTQWSAATLLKRATNTWLLTGDVTA